MSGPSAERRKTLTEAWLRTPREMGVYQIRNVLDDRIFVAASRDLRARFNRHRLELKTGSERTPGLSPELQRDYEAHGADTFVYEVLDLLDPVDEPGWDPREDLAVLEALWLEKLAPWDARGYNTKR